ncbi:putative bifunctional diguanylate cyclase/phosphodiesterase [Ferribacterium limneticum]|uniref:putative bifunctional diguanylate cyclase/phosphodiesterase n=1 Tax=Ferribacterium limneticum TaxID=76259 RepID=UPI001CFBE918|nr:GGDEF domain-containing phosphodiesterase [Ferribacterium limneticum]UCV28096.1 EAL domain-containing protein [Ferribacterium limneticum]UCV32013.1 EAL domain-containing protein [Ferribacterium limneticum]
MTTTLDNDGFIDYAAFGVSPENLRSLRALSGIWRAAVLKVADDYGANAAFEEFCQRSLELPQMINDVAWQQRWTQAWYKLSGRGFELADMFGFFNRAIACAEADLFGEQLQVSRVQLDLFAILRRSVVAAISCAIELGEEAHRSGVGLPGELSAMRTFRQLAENGRGAAVLSASMVNRRALSHLTAGELQSLPVLLADRLAALLRPQDKVFVGHEGEWLLLLPEVQSAAQPVLAASQIRRAFGHPLVLLSGRGVSLDVAIGAAMSPEHGDDAEEIIRAARLARASLQSSNEAFAMYEPRMQEDWQRRHQLAEELREALRKDRLTMYLQPQVDVETECCPGAELLLRWQRANGEWVPPPLIVEMIEEYGWRDQFTDWLIRTALRMGVELAAAGVDVRLSLNLTAGDLLDTDLPELVAQCLETWRLPAERFTFELTESAMMVDRERGLSVMSKLRDMGIRLALDDFGTGYSSLSYLATLPLNEIKIDRSFVVGMTSSAENLRIVRTIIDLTHDLGMISLAEGVEEVGERDQLLALGCDRIQGYFYGKPMPFSDFVAWYRARQA